MRHYNDFQKPFLETAMTAMKKVMITHLILFFISSLHAAEPVFIPGNSLLFKYEKGKNAWEVKATVQNGFSCEVIKKEKIFMQLDSATGVYLDAYQLKIPGSSDLRYFPMFSYKIGKDGKIIPFIEKLYSLMFFGVFLIILGAAALAG